MSDATSPATPFSTPHLFCFGFGYSVAAFARLLRGRGWKISGTCRSEEKRLALLAEGVRGFVFDRGRPLVDPAAALADVTHVVSSVPPDTAGDAVLDQHAAAIGAAPGLRWIGYLSTTGVYGDTGGAVVDEAAPVRPTVGRSVRRAAAERSWLALHAERGLPVHVFRLAGIYGPGRNTLDQVRRGEARRVERPGHVFSRIHIDDIAAVLSASVDKPHPGRIYNVCDDEPAAPAEVVAWACRLLGVPIPAAVSFEEAAASMSPMARSFWQDNRRVDNARIKRELGVQLRYPTFREGLTALAGGKASPSG